MVSPHEAQNHRQARQEKVEADKQEAIAETGGNGFNVHLTPDNQQCGLIRIAPVHPGLMQGALEIAPYWLL